MGARSGNNYLSASQAQGAEVGSPVHGSRILPRIPRWLIVPRSVASLYDMQMEHPETMTFRTDDGGRAGMSFIIPKSADDLRKRTRDDEDVGGLSVAGCSGARRTTST